MNSCDVFLSNFNITPGICGYFVCSSEKVWSHTTHAFSQCKFYCITKGKCHITVSGKEFTACEGDWFFIPAGCQHAYSSIDNTRFEKFWVHFDIYPNNDFIDSLDLPPFVKNVSPGRIHLLFKKLIRLYKSNDVADKIAQKAVLAELFAAYVRIAHPGGLTAIRNSSKKMEDILKYIMENIRRPLSVSDIAAAFYMHPNCFFRFFKDNTGQSPAKYIKMLKMGMVKRYLEETDIPISEIMYMVGECDTCSFSKKFKSIYSYSPREYRKYFRNA